MWIIIETFYTLYDSQGATSWQVTFNSQRCGYCFKPWRNIKIHKMQKHCDIPMTSQCCMAMPFPLITTVYVDVDGDAFITQFGLVFRFSRLFWEKLGCPCQSCAMLLHLVNLKVCKGSKLRSTFMATKSWSQYFCSLWILKVCKGS